MAVLRIVEYPGMDELPENAVEIWTRHIGTFLQDAPCTRAILATDAGSMTVVTEWESREALEASLGSDEYRAVTAKVTEEMGISSDLEPARTYHGTIEAAI